MMPTDEHGRSDGTVTSSSIPQKAPISEDFKSIQIASFGCPGFNLVPGNAIRPHASEYP